MQFPLSPATRTAALAILLALGARGADVTINLSAVSGLKFEPSRFVVEPGAHVTVEFNNTDDMIHNFVVVQPGSRLAVVEAALALGEKGPGRNFLPESDRILAAMPVVNPGRKGQVTFTAPTTEGVYPYVCTFPGHGYIMFGAMYVAQHIQLPPLAKDPNVPAPIVAATAATLKEPTLQRTFLADCGPAAIAVGLPGGQAYCFDATQCRMRYAWRGGFIDNSNQLLGKGDQFAQVLGRIYYRPSATARLRIGDISRPPVVKWHGWRTVAGQPQLAYSLDGAEVTESPQLSPDGKNLQLAYEIKAASGPVTFVADARMGAKITSSAGAWSGNRLTLTPAEARRFTLTLIEQPGVEPIGYWSMNDLPFAGRKDPLPGVVGRAFTPGGNLGRWEVLDTRIKLSEVLHNGTLMAWVKSSPAPKVARAVVVSPTGPVFSAGEDEHAFRINAPEPLARWQHLAAVLQHGTMTLYINGKEVSQSTVPAIEPEATLRIGSLGKKEFLSGLIDEVRIFDRSLTPAEIASVYQREHAEAAAKTETQ